MAHIHDLPTELLLRIISQIPLKRDLSSLCFVSRLFQRLSESYLYHTYENGEVSTGQDYRQPRVSDRKFSAASLRSFTRTILQNARLRKKVKVLNLRSWSTGSGTGSQRTIQNEPTVYHQDIALFLAAGESLALSNGELQPSDWPQLVSQGSSDAILKLLLAHLSDLQQLHVEYGTGMVLPWDFVVRMATNRIAFPQGALQNLHRLEVVVTKHEEEAAPETRNGVGIGLDFISPFLLLPQLRQLRGFAWESFAAGNTVWHCPPSASRVSDIDLEQCTLDNQSIAVLIGSLRPRSLRSFRYHSASDGPHFAPALLKEFLRQHQNTLEALELCAVSAEWQREDLTVRDILLGSLADFARLRLLITNEWCLLPYDIWNRRKLEHGRRLVDSLPQSLEMFELRECRDAGLEQFMPLAAAAGRTVRGSTSGPIFPNLKAVAVRIEPEGVGKDWTHVATVFAVNGVHFSV